MNSSFYKSLVFGLAIFCFNGVVFSAKTELKEEIKSSIDKMDSQSLGDSMISLLGALDGQVPGELLNKMTDMGLLVLNKTTNITMKKGAGSISDVMLRKAQEATRNVVKRRISAHLRDAGVGLNIDGSLNVSKIIKSGG